MRITDLLKKEGICLNAGASDKESAVDTLVGLHSDVGNLTDRDGFKAAIMAREEKGSTAIGMGIAVPHAKSAAVKNAGLVAMTVPAGLDYKALDGNPSKLFFMIAAPDTAAVRQPAAPAQPAACPENRPAAARPPAKAWQAP